MLKLNNTSYFVVILFFVMKLSAQTVPSVSEVEKLLEATGMSMDELQVMMQTQTEDDASISNQSGNIENFKVDKDKIKSEIEAEIKESIDLDPIINEINISSGNDTQVKDGSDTAVESFEDESFLSEDVSKKIKEKKSQIVEEVLIKDDERKLFFGYDIFQRDPEIFQKSISESIDPNYLIGPGDEIVVMLWGETEFNREYIVTRDGYLFIPNIGQVFVNSCRLTLFSRPPPTL